MDIRRRFPDVHWVWKGGVSFVYEVHPRIIMKVPKSGNFAQEQFQKELKIYEIFSQHPSCPSIVQCFLYADNGIFLEYMRECKTTTYTRGPQTAVVTKVEKLEPLSLRKEWMNDLAQGIAFLDSLNLAHGDLSPENIFLDRNRLKPSDFDCTAEIGSDFEACLAPYGRILNSNEPDQGRRGSSGFLDQRLTADPKEHGRKVVELLQNMEFPQLDGDPLIDDIITKCWHNKYATIAELAGYTETLLPGRNSRRDNTEAEEVSTPQWHTVIGRGIRGLWKRFRSWWISVLCRTTTREVTKPEDLPIGGEEPDGYSEPEQLAFSLEWYRHSTS
ncbi:kinase-like domain-containing protein [Aspergillus heterothallicus]